MKKRQAWMGLLMVLAVVSIGALVHLLSLAAGGEELTKIRGAAITVHDATGWLTVALVAVVLSLVAWARAEWRLAALPAVESALEDARAAEQEAGRRVDAAEDEREKARSAERESSHRVREAEKERDRMRQERQQERVTAQRMAQGWRSEREWNRDLRVQVERMQRAQGVLGRHDDSRRMVLELTMGLVDAEKGLLLSDHETADGRREVVCFSGFDNDPQDSAIAQRFAGQVIERDRTVREDDCGRVAAEQRSPADEEVRNLLAIPIYLSDNFAGVIVCANREGGFATLDDEVLLAIGDHAGAVLQNSRMHGDLRNAYLSTIRVLADAIELKDPELRGHSDSVSEYVLAVADRLDLSPQEREELIFASLLHDVGKLGISERILLKPASLTPEERSVIQMHPRIGYELVNQVPALRHIAPAVLHHHERYDGDGYPGQLRGETIPLAARIIAIADSFSAITSDRPYSPAQSPAEACVELERCAGGQFDPEVVRLFVEEVRRRPPTRHAADSASPDPGLEVHRAEGEFKLGSRSFGITDSLTLLYSHRHFHESAAAQAQRAALQNRAFGIVIARLDGLDQCNRSQGFITGDVALQTVAEIMQQAASRLDGQAFRVSGRRLGLLAPGADHAQTMRAARELQGALQTALAGHELGVSIGVGTWLPGEAGEDVIYRATCDIDSAVAA